MRMRKKPWARPELEAWDRFVQNPREKIGQWQEFFGNSNPIHIELGCGKGGFISKIAPAHPEINYIAIDLKDEVLGLAKRKLVAEYEALGVPQTNIALMAHDIERLNSMLLPSEKIDRIYINFCNPWSEKERHEKHRLTHTKQLLLYRKFLSPDAEIHFKTDSDVLFEDSLGYFKEAGFEIKYLTYDLHESGYENNIPTEHEQMYTEQGIKIKFLIAKLI